MSYVVNNHLDNLYVFSNKAVGPGKKNPKLINIGPMFMPYYRVFLFFLIVAKFYNFRQIQGIMRVH